MFSDPISNIQQFHIDPGMSVADLGSGVGFYTMLLSEIVGPSGSVYAVDVQKELLDKLNIEANNKGLKNIKYIWGDLDESGGTKIRDHSVDRVLASNVLFQVEKPESFINEISRILKRKTGKVLLIDWADSFGGMGPTPGSVVKPDVARTMFENAGFIFEKDINAGDHHYGLIFKVL